MSADTLDVLLIEDNHGDARLIEEMLRTAQNLLHRIDFDGRSPERIGFHHEVELPAGLAHLASSDVDVILLDLGLAESTGLDTLETVVETTEFTPVVVLTGLDDRDLGIQAIKRGAQDYLVKDEVNGALLVHSIQYAIERARQNCERVRYREQLETLNELNTITQELTHDIIMTSTRQELEQAVCERLVESDAYQFAWIGEMDWQTGRLSSRVTTGGDRLADDLTFAMDEADDHVEMKAVRTQDVQIGREVDTESDFELDQPRPGRWVYRSIAAVPISYRSIFYGVLVIYATSPTAFSTHEAPILERLGEVIGHTITAIERKNALVSDTALQLEFRLEGVADDLVALTTDEECTIAFENIVKSDSALLVYGQAEGLPQTVFETFAEKSDDVENLRILSPAQDDYEFEFRTGAADAIVSAIASHGGHVVSGSIQAGEFRFVLEFPRGRDKRQLVELVKNACAGATLQAHRTVQRDNPSIPDSRSVFQNRLTEKQRAALETAFHAGYFEWPRTASGEEIAERLGITQATFSEHFRAAEREVFGSIFEHRRDEDASPSSPWESSESDSQHD